jgi:predicted ATPase/DNA-binding NarL/FixJ family response regulator
LPVPLAPVPAWSHQDVGFPAVLPPLVGRDRELEALCALLRESERRLVTLIGPGGVGKTRLAIAAALSSEAEFDHGAVFVPLAATSGSRLVVPTIAKALGLRETPERPLMEVLLSFLRDRHTLLVLDNFEHVVDAAIDVFAVLERCPRTTVLVTSRSPLRLHEEQRYTTPPLAVPDSVDATTPEDIATYGAIGLFVERARSVSNQFALDDENASAVAEICRRLDGIPLAIELAAAWVRVLPPAAILARLEPQLPLLKGGTGDQPARLRTMRDAIAWSHDLLTDEERRLFRRMAVFVGGFDLEAAEQVNRTVVTNGGETASCLDLIAELSDKSLLRQTPSHGAEPRFSMLETVREFALDQLTESGEAAAIEAGYAGYFLALAERADPELMGPQQAVWFERLEAEHANLRAALAWFLKRGDGERGLRLANALNWFWSSRGHFREARGWLESFLALPTAPATRGRGLVEAANILHWQGEHAQATAYATEALPILRNRGEHYHALCALRRLGSIAIDEGNLDRAAERLAECRELLGLAGSAWDVAFASYLAGRLAVAAGNFDEAVGHFGKAADAFRAIGDRGYVASALGQRGAASILTLDFSAARAAYAESLELAWELRDRTSVAWALTGAAHLAHAAGAPANATRLLAAATTMREVIGEGRLPTSALSDAVESALGSERFSREWTHGSSWFEAKAIAEARAVLAGDGGHAVTRGERGVADEFTLTRRQRDVLRLLVEGYTDKEIGAALGLSRSTVSNHVGAILIKLGVESRTAAAAVVLRPGLL